MGVDVDNVDDVGAVDAVVVVVVAAAVGFVSADVTLLSQ